MKACGAPLQPWQALIFLASPILLANRDKENVGDVIMLMHAKKAGATHYRLANI